jgi:hypothetical protein
MGIGLGIALMVVGAALMWAIKPNLDFINDNALGLIFIIAGALAVVLSLVLNTQRRKSTHVEERRYE